MTVSSTTNRKTYTGDNATTSFSTSPVVFFDTSDLTVYVVVTATGVSETLVENTDYTVTGGSGAVGTVNLAGGSSPYGAPLSTQKVVIVRNVPATQQTDFANNDTSDAEVVEDALDRLTMIAQQNNTKLERSLRQPDEDPTDIGDLPNAVDRASKYMAFDASGDPVATAGTTSSYVVSTFAETILDDTSAAAVRSTIGASATTPADDTFRVVGSADATKKLAFEVDGFTTGQTRTVTFPDANLTFPAVTAAGDIVQASASGTLARLGIGSARQVPQVNAGATALAYANPITLATQQASTSGASIDFTSIPAGVRRITVMFAGVSTNGTSPLLIQIGDSGGVETSGYLGTGSAITTASAGAALQTAGFAVEHTRAATRVTHGAITLSLMNAATFSWVAAGVTSNSDVEYSNFCSGSKSLSAELDRVRITTVGGTDTFDAGAINISYE